MSDIESKMLKQGLIKVPADKTSQKENAYRRVAKFLFIIGKEQASQVLKQLSKEQIDKVVAELVTIQTIDKTEALEILNEFNALYAKNKNSLGGVETAKDILVGAFGSDKAEEILEKAVPEKRPIPFDYLQGIGDDALVRLLSGELPSAKAIVLSQLETKQAANYIKTLDSTEEKKEIILHLAKMKKIDSSILHTISEALKKKMIDVNLNKTSAIDGTAVLADILRSVDYKTGEDILDSLETEDEELADSIRNKLITLNDVLNMNPRHIQYLLSPMSDNELALLIHTKSEDFRKTILSNLSKVRASIVLQEEEFISPIPKKEINDATNLFLSRLKAAVKNGRVIIEQNNNEQLWIE